MIKIILYLVSKLINMKRIWNFFFNPNVGYVLHSHFYDFEGNTFIGYVICKEFRFMGLYGYDRIAFCIDMNEVRETLTRLGISLKKE